MRPGRRRRRGTAEPAGHQKRNSGTARSRNCAVEDRNTRMRRLSARARSRRFVLRHPASPRVLCPVTPSAHFAGSAVASSSCAPRALRSLWFVSYVLALRTSRAPRLLSAHVLCALCALRGLVSYVRLLRTSRAPGLFSAHVCSARSALSAVRLQLLVLRTSRAPRLLPAHVLCALCALRGFGFVRTASAHFASSAVASSSCALRALRSLRFVPYSTGSAHFAGSAVASAHVLCALCALRGLVSYVRLLRTSRALRLFSTRVVCALCALGGWFRSYSLHALRRLCGCLVLEPVPDDRLHDPVLARARQPLPHPEVELPIRRHVQVDRRHQDVMLL